MTVAGVSGTKNDIGLSSPYVQKYFVFACLEDWDFFFRGFAVHSYYQVRNSILLEEKFYKRSQLIITLFLYSVHISFEQFSPLVFFCAAYIPLTKINWVFLSWWKIVLSNNSQISNLWVGCNMHLKKFLYSSSFLCWQSQSCVMCKFLMYKWVIKFMKVSHYTVALAFSENVLSFLFFYLGNQQSLQFFKSGASLATGPCC